MTKKEFIQLVIRTCGVILLITAFNSIIKGVGTGLAMLMIQPVSDPSVFLTTLVLAGQSIRAAIFIIVIFYLLFGGKIIAKIVDRTSSLELESPLPKENYPEILIRFIGVWWLWKILRQIFLTAYSFLTSWLLSHPQWFFRYLDESDETITRLQELVNPIQERFFWLTLADVPLYALLAWYFLKGGKFFMNLLNHRWIRKKNIENNPVIP